MAKKAKTKDVVKKTIEQTLWDSANELRGNLDAAEYKSVVLGLVFLKYINDCFKVKHDELVAEGEGFEEDPDEYIGDNIFFVPVDARWEKVVNASLTAEIGAVVDAAMEALEKENKQLKGILPKNYARPELDKRRLGNVIDIFENNLHFTGSEARDVLGRVYEYFLGEFAREEGKKGGEFYTPSCVVRTIVEVIQPYKGKIFDPACGSGGMFVQSSKFIERHQGNINKISVYGQELNSNTWKLAQMNLAICGIEANFGDSFGDSFHDDKHPFLKADFVMANPPFNISKWGGDQLRDDPRWQYGIPPEGNANFAWMQHMIHHLQPAGGRIGLVLANGALSSQTSGEGDIRANIVAKDLVEGIIAMPDKLFYSTGIPVSLWIITNKKAQPGKTLFIDARDMGTMVSRKLREFTDEDIAKVSGAFDAFRAGTLEEEKGFSAIATTEDIAKQDYILTPGRYVGIAEPEDDGEPFEEKMKRLTGEISKCFEESSRLQEQIKKNLEAIGYGM